MLLRVPPVTDLVSYYAFIAVLFLFVYFTLPCSQRKEQEILKEANAAV